MRWSELETLKFVKIYLRHENLWNPCDSNYKMKNKRQRAYNNIITEFHTSTGILMSETELKIKIKNLRSTYTQEVSKIRQRSSSNFVYTPTIKWFAEWHSCFSAIKKRIDGFDDSASHDHKNGNDSKQMNPPVSQSDDDDYLILVKAEPQNFSLNVSQRIRKKRKTKRSPNIENSERALEVSSTNNSVEDEFDIYGKYLAAQLRNMDIYRALRTQLEIQSIVSEARIASLSGT